MGGGTRTIVGVNAGDRGAAILRLNGHGVADLHGACLDSAGVAAKIINLAAVVAHLLYRKAQRAASIRPAAFRLSNSSSSAWPSYHGICADG